MQCLFKARQRPTQRPNLAKAGAMARQRERSESTDKKPKMKHIRCRFFFSENGECRNGGKCPYSHSKNTPERGRETSPFWKRTPSRSPSTGKPEKERYTFKNTGSCKRDDCPYAHITQPTLAEGKPKAKAKAKADAKAEAKPKPKGMAKALPAAPAFRLCRAWNPVAPAIQQRANPYEDEASDCSSLDSLADSGCSTHDEAFGRTLSANPQRGKHVSFAKNVRFQSSRPRRSHKERGDRVVKVNVKNLVENENRVNEFGFAMHKARLKAQMMIDMIEDDKPGRHVYVRVPGSNDVRQIIFYDGEDELMESAKSKKIRTFEKVTCMVQPTWIGSKIKFLMDTGCGHDLIFLNARSRSTGWKLP